MQFFSLKRYVRYHNHHHQMINMQQGFDSPVFTAFFEPQNTAHRTVLQAGVIICKLIRIQYLPFVPYEYVPYTHKITALISVRNVRSDLPLHY